MLVKDVAKLTPLERFEYWIRERHSIYLNRKAGKKRPWTDDEVLQSYFFTNPYRENDKVTVWFRDNIREQLRDSPDVLFATVCFRWFNLPSTGLLLYEEGLINEWDCERAVELLSSIEGKVFTGAFNISNSGSTKPKVNRVCEDYITPVWNDLDKLVPLSLKWKRMEQAHRQLMQYPGLGGSGFMAYEVVCDLRYTFLLENAVDKHSWSNPGPGAKRGINRLLGRELGAGVKDWPIQSAKLLQQMQRRLSGKVPPLEMREIEHSLCEWDKYERARLNDGHMKRRYAGA